MQHPQQRQSRPPIPWKRLVVICVVSLLLLGVVVLIVYLRAVSIINDALITAIATIVIPILVLLFPLWQALFPSAVNQSTYAPISVDSSVASTVNPQSYQVASSPTPQPLNHSAPQLPNIPTVAGKSHPLPEEYGANTSTLRLK